jgi:hypothetical protein
MALSDSQETDTPSYVIIPDIMKKTREKQPLAQTQYDHESTGLERLPIIRERTTQTY